MTHWQAPLAKNTSAMVAIRASADPQSLFLVCLDADNVLVPGHVQRILERLEERAQFAWYKRLLIIFAAMILGCLGGMVTSRPRFSM